MSKPAPIHGGSRRLRSPACALLDAQPRLGASPVALPVHGVSTTGATTPGRHQHELTGTPIRRATTCRLMPRPRQIADERVWPCAITRHSSSRCPRGQLPRSPTTRAPLEASPVSAMKSCQFTCPAHSVASAAARAVRGSSRVSCPLAWTFSPSCAHLSLGTHVDVSPYAVTKPSHRPRPCGQAPGAEHRTST
jgi:hypothetical protein